MNKKELPDLETFKKAARRLRGHKSNMADYFGVDRHTLLKWMRENPEYEIVVNNSRMRCFDDIYDRAYLLANGIPDYREVETANGQKQLVFNGWIERPDGQMQRYLLGTLGREEGFGEHIDVTTNGESINHRTVAFGQEIKSPEDAKRIMDEIQRIEESC